MTANSLQQLQKAGQSVWLDNIRRNYLTGGELQRLIDLGVTGLTSNPSIFEKAITSSSDYDDSLMALSKQDKDESATSEAVALIGDVSGSAFELVVEGSTANISEDPNDLGNGTVEAELDGSTVDGSGYTIESDDDDDDEEIEDSKEDG